MDSAMNTSVPTPLLMPTLADHRGRGILPGDWIKPDPTMTRREVREYLITETRQWLTGGRLGAQAREIGIAGLSPLELTEIVGAGQWPAARLWLLESAMDEGSGSESGSGSGPRDPVERTCWVGGWAADVCERILRGAEPVGSLETLAAGFVLVDRLPCGRTIASWWNASPFEPLRAAAVLTEGDESGVGGPLGLDDRLDEITDVVVDFFRGSVVVRIPVWVAAVAWIVQLWVVAFLAGRGSL